MCADPFSLDIPVEKNLKENVHIIKVPRRNVGRDSYEQHNFENCFLKASVRIWLWRSCYVDVTENLKKIRFSLWVSYDNYNSTEKITTRVALDLGAYTPLKLIIIIRGRI